jgi:hypothetical protein
MLARLVAPIRHICPLCLLSGIIAYHQDSTGVVFVTMRRLRQLLGGACSHNTVTSKLSAWLPCPLARRNFIGNTLTTLEALGYEGSCDLQVWVTGRDIPCLPVTDAVVSLISNALSLPIDSPVPQIVPTNMASTSVTTTRTITPRARNSSLPNSINTLHLPNTLKAVLTTLLENVSKETMKRTAVRTVQTLSTCLVETLNTYICEQCDAIQARVVIVSPVLIFAPPNTAHTIHGRIHRDAEISNSVDRQSRFWSVWVCLTDVTVENGAVNMWPGTETVTLLTKAPGRAVSGRKAQTMLGLSGSVCVFDSRLLHQSMPNVTNSARVCAQWFLVPDGHNLEIDT